jgi:hypothetical protein
MKLHYNILLGFAGINNFENKYVQALVYINLIFLMLIYSPICYSIYLSIKYESIKYLVNSLQNLRDILFIIFFYSNKKLCKYIQDFLDTHCTLMKKNIKIFYICSIVFSFLTAIIFAILKKLDYITFDSIDYLNIHPNNINSTNNITSNVTTSIMFFNVFYTLIIDAIIIFHFILIFNYHANNISVYSEQLQDENEFQLTTITQQLIEIRYNYNESVSLFNKTFSINVSCGFIIIFFFAETLITDYTQNSPRSYMSVLLFITIILGFQIIINKIKNNLDDLKQYSANNRFMNRILGRKKENYIVDLENIGVISVKHMLLDIENAETLDWIVFNKVLDMEFTGFDLFGFDWDNGAVILKFIAIIITYVLGANLIGD